MKKVADFIQSVVQEKDGFSLDEAWRLNENSINVVIPVLRKTDHKREYITLAEAKDVKIEDTGQIDGVYIKNNEDKPLLVSRGEYFRSKSQERASIHGHIIEAGKGMRIAVRCIHQSNPITAGQEMEYGGKIPSSINLASQGNTWDSIRAYTSGQDYSEPDEEVLLGGMGMLEDLGADQILGSADNMMDSAVRFSSMNVNSSVENSSRQLKSSSPQPPTPKIPNSDDLVSSLDGLSDSMKDILQKIPYIENQSGVIFLFENDIQGLDIYDVSESWHVVKEDVVEKEGEKFIEKEEDNLFEFHPEKVKALLNKKLGIEFQEKTIYDGKDYQIVEIREVLEKTEIGKKKRLMGEAVIMKDNIVHLTMFKN